MAISANALDAATTTSQPMRLTAARHGPRFAVPWTAGVRSNFQRQEKRLGKTRIVYTCSECGGTHDGEIDHAGEDGDQIAAAKHVTGRRGVSSPLGTLCLPCLDKWIRSMASDHLARCLEAAKHRELRTGKTEAVFTPHYRGKDGTGLGTWVRSDERFQVIQAGAKSLRPSAERWITK